MQRIKIENPGSVKYENRFIPGDKVKSLTHVDFIDGTSHRVGEIVEVSEGNCAYYNVMHKYYEKV